MRRASRSTWREIEVPPPAALLVLAQDRRDVGAVRVPPDRVGWYDRVARSLVDGIGQRQRHAACRGFDAIRLADVFQTLVVVAEPETPFGLDRARRRLVDHVDNALALALGDLGERVLERFGGSRIAVPVKRHVGQAAMRRDGRRLPFRALERRHIGRRSSFRVRALVVGDIERAHGTSPIISASTWHTEPAFSRPCCSGHANPRRACPENRRTFSNAEMPSRPAECLSRSLSRACGSEVDQQKRPYLICSCRLALLGFWWNDLTADFAARIGLGMDVDVPLTGGKLLRLLGRERPLPLNRVFRGAG